MMCTRKRKKPVLVEKLDIHLPPGLAARVQRFADERGVDPQAVLVESVRLYIEAPAGSSVDLNAIEASLRKYRH
ncbi:hypothetical protein [Paraburkholderia tropica]|uniref:hypothetical protein n=1 Tax=Paraburkholderia tropica TaxID=92647 RepID=UPI002AB78BA0|nr:hypothetical protein [Paraburkholderia tropica]